MPVSRHVQERVGSSSTYRSGPSCSLFPAVRFTAKHHDEEAAENQHGGGSRHAHDVGDHCAVSPGLGVVVIAVQHYLVYQRSDLVLRRLDQSEANVLRGKLNSVVVLSNLASRRHDHDGRRVNELSVARMQIMVLRW